MLFKTLMNNENLIDLDISNNDNLHRNRIGAKGCKPLRHLLRNNHILTILNISDNAIGLEGLFIINTLFFFY